MKVKKNGVFVEVGESTTPPVDPESGTDGAGLPIDIHQVSHPANDDFTGETLNPKWTLGAKGGIFEMGDGFLNIRPLDSSTKAVTISQPCPTSGSFAIYGKLSSATGMTLSDNRPGIYLGSSAGNRSIVCGIGLSGGPANACGIGCNTYSAVADWGEFGGSWSSNQGGTYGGGDRWFRIVWDGTSVTCAYSINGVRWRDFYNQIWATAPDVMGIAMYSNGGTLNPAEEITVDWFRCIDYSQIPDLNNSIAVPYVSDGPTGLINAMGRSGLPDFVNPASSGRLVSSSSSVYEPGMEPLRAFDHNFGTFLHTQGQPGSWFKMDFGAQKQVTVTRYGMAGRNDNGHRPRQFRLEGSTDDVNWTVLDNHDGLASNNGPNSGAWWSAPVTDPGSYRYLRIFNWGSTTDGSNFLILSEVELWGTITQNVHF